MTTVEETLVYDALAAMMDSKVLCDLVNRCGTEEEKEAYRRCLYGPAVKLQVVLGQKAMDRGRARHEKVKKDADEFFAKTNPSQSPVQHFREECHADRGYKFVRREGEDAIWQFKGREKTFTVRIKPNGDVEDI
jgi:hypothetical protein